jgi:pyruvate-formate lyase-activating enzyme
VKVGVISAYTDYHRAGRRNRLALQPQIGPVIASQLPAEAQVEVINETWAEPDWRRDYDLLFLSSLHADFDRAKQLSHFWRRRGAKTVFGGPLATSYPDRCQPFFDAVVVGDVEGSVPKVYADFAAGRLEPLYRSTGYDPRALSTPRIDLAPKGQLFPLVVEASRGCPFTCEFCMLTGSGTRYLPRQPEAVAAEISQMQTWVRGAARQWRRRVVLFSDNNIGGNLSFLRALCAALEPLNIAWTACTTFNVASNPDLVRRMAAAGCQALFVGLESLNSKTLTEMRKVQNAANKTRQLIELCRRQGIHVVSGILLNPVTDDLRYMEELPRLLRECGLRVPTFIAFETPFPGTPYFKRLAAEPEPAFLPGALLRDFSGYTLTVKPRNLAPAEFIAGYRALVAEVYGVRSRLDKFVRDVPYFALRGQWLAATLAGGQFFSDKMTVNADRSYLAGTDRPPLERVPLVTEDFATEQEFDAVMRPTPVTDADGHVLRDWFRVAPVQERGEQPRNRVLRARATSVALPGRTDLLVGDR